MKILICPSSFKGTLSSTEVGETILSCSRKQDTCESVSFSDGGEGFLDALKGYGNKREVLIHNPLNEVIQSEYLIDNNKAYIESAKCIGLSLIPPKRRNPLIMSSYGLGEMIKDGINKGVREFVIGLGGSGTSDAGLGMMKALGYQFLDKLGNEVGSGINGLSKVFRIDDSKKIESLNDCLFILASDVNSSLLGEKGAVRCFGRQKGLKEKDIEYSENSMKNFSEVIKEYKPSIDVNMNGGGAAGGVGFALMAFLNSRYVSGSDFIIRINNLEDKLSASDLVIVGEGKIDEQTLLGKGPYKIAKLAKEYSKKVVAFTGINTLKEESYKNVFDEVIEISSKNEKISHKKAMDDLKRKASLFFEKLD